MAHPDKTRAGSEKGQRPHAGTTTAASDAGLKTRSQGGRGRTRVASAEDAGPPGAARTPEAVEADSARAASRRSGVAGDSEPSTGSPGDFDTERQRPGKD